MQEQSPSIRAFIFALLIYCFVVFIVFFKLIKIEEKAIEFTDIEHSFINVEIGDNINKMPSKQTNDDTQSLQSLFENNILQKYTTNKNVNTQDIEQQASQLNELFGTLDEYQEEKTNKVQSSLPSKKPIFSQRSEILDFSKQLDENLKLNKELGQSLIQQKVGIYDQFLGLVRRQLEDRWRIYNPSVNISIDVEFIIDTNGYFYLINYSKSLNDDFDKKVDEFLKNLEGKYIALPPNGKINQIKMKLSDVIEFKTEE